MNLFKLDPKKFSFAEEKRGCGFFGEVFFTYIYYV